jgi:hypothetical protein
VDRDEAIRLLKGWPDGIREWNERQGRREEIPDLSGADLSRAVLIGADLSRADLSGAGFSGAVLRGAGFSGAVLRGAGFSGADLYGAVLIRADLRDANLGGVYLNRADLRHAHLGGADLRGAHLVEANLGGADLRQADLGGADLGGADLFDADLRGAHLGGADLGGAKCGLTIFGVVDLSEVKGLDSIVHAGPSTVGVDMLVRSRGRIPEAFLRGCGVPDTLIAYLPAIIGGMEPIQFYSCFISYSSKDQDFVDRLHADLQVRGVRCWLDRENLVIGDKFRQRIDEAILVYDKLMLVLSERSLASDWVEGEVEAALEREGREKRIVLFPIRLDDQVLETPVGWAAHIRRTRHIGDFTGWKDHDAYRKALDRLLRDLQASAATGQSPGREGQPEGP